MTTRADDLEPLTPDAQSILGALWNAALIADAEAAGARMPRVAERLGAYTPAPALIGENFAALRD